MTITLGGAESPQVRPFESADEASVLDLLAADRLPGQPACSAVMLADAVAGRSVVDPDAGAALEGTVITTVLCAPDGGIAGIVSCAGHPGDGTSLLLWLHCYEDFPTAQALIAQALECRGAGPVQAFTLACALSRGLVGLPEHRRRVTREALQAAGFTSRCRCRYLRAELPIAGLPHLAGVQMNDTAQPPGKHLEVRRRGRILAQAALEYPAAGVGLIRSITVAPDARGQGMGLGLLGNALDVLVCLGAREAIVYLNEMPADPERDPVAALRTYAASDFTEVDRLLTFTRPSTLSLAEA
ncbi:GNAT family N-acetyltransferase [Streptomyces sp. NPDC007251]|uniref:GNAT family N-acetyltransferase n=1 Tax=Streptomyces sp. NPDC007251 TaxID=3154483 RepID=UPI0033F3A301